MLKVAIIGAGNIASEHLQAYLALEKQFSVVTICDLDLERATQMAAKVQSCKAVARLEDVLADAQIDIVDICLPPKLHGPTAISALEAGKHVVCEKPLACSVSEAKKMASIARKSERVLMPIFQYRYGHSCNQLLALKDAGLCSKPYVASLETHWNRGSDYYQAAPWRGSKKIEQGGVVLNHAIHIHDLIAMFFGAISSATAVIDTRVNEIETEDCAAITFTTVDGGLVTSSITLGAADDTSRIKLVYEHLTVESAQEPYAIGMANWQFTARDKARQSEIDKIIAAVPKALSGFAGQLDSFSRFLAGEDVSIVSIEDGIRSIETVTAIYLSAAKGIKVSLPLDGEQENTLG